MLRDAAVGNPIEEHQIRTDRPSSCLDAGERPAVNTLERSAQRDEVAFGHQILGYELIERKRRLGMPDVLGKRRIADKALDQRRRLRLAAQCLQVTSDQLLVFPLELVIASFPSASLNWPERAC